MSRFAAIVCGIAALSPVDAWAESATVSPVDVVAPTPLGASSLGRDQLAGSLQTLRAADFARTGSASITDALQQRLAGVSVADSQGNPFAGGVDYRGFSASPLQGQAQGLAVYLNGIRLNEAFGDTVNWDLIPQIAIDRADLITADPAFGQNAIGGAIALHMKDGFSTSGLRGSVQGGSFGRAYGSAEYGAGAGPWGLYVAADGGREDGWRLQSPSRVARAYADLGWKDGRSELHLIASGAANLLGVVGPTPVGLVAANRAAVYTYPQQTRTDTGLLAVNGRLQANPAWSLDANLYLRKFNQRHVDGNDGDFEGCSRSATSPLVNTLCMEDDDFPSAVRPAAAAFQILGPDNRAIGCPPLVAGQTKTCNGIAYGTIDRTRTDAASIGGTAQATGRGLLFGRANSLSLGANLQADRADFSSDSSLGLIHPNLDVSPDPTIPGMGQLIHTAGNIGYGPVSVSSHTDRFGLYVSDVFTLTSDLSLNLNARYNAVRIRMADLTGVSPSLTATNRFDHFDPGAGVTWRIGAALVAYGSYSQADRAPTPLELGCGDPAKPCLLENALVSDPPLKQVTATTAEAGLHSAAGAPLAWSLALFRTDSDNDIVALASVIQGRGYYTNVPRTRREGLEASVRYQAGRWMAYADYAYVDATYRFTGDLPSANNPSANAAGNVHVTPGDRLGGVPPQRFKAGADFTPTPALTVGADVVGIGAQYYVGDEANQNAKLPGYALLGVHGAYRVGRVELFAHVDNLLDQRYASSGTYFQTDALANVRPSPLPSNPDARTIVPGAPRAVSVGVRVAW